MDPEMARRGQLVYLALGFLGRDVPAAAMPFGLSALHAWLDTGMASASSSTAWRARPGISRSHVTPTDGAHRCS